MLTEKNLNILKEEIVYLNSKGNRVPRKPFKCIGAFISIEAAFDNLIIAKCQYIHANNIKNKQCLSDARIKIIDSLLKEFNEGSNN